MLQRLQKIISAAGLASRRGAEIMIQSGRVQVNGQTARLGMSADPEIDLITLDGAAISGPEARTYIMLNKPQGYVTTLHDEKNRKNVAQLVQNCGVRLYPVGRLDMYSEGLLIMTNDGEIANRLMHPSHHVHKTYLVTVDADFRPEQLTRLAEPMEIDGYTVQAVSVEIHAHAGKTVVLAVTIGEGRNRQIRKMCRQCGLHLRRLQRIIQGELKLGNLPCGQWRYLTGEEVQYLQSLLK